MGKLIITDLSKLKITKVKNWAIYFNYDNEKYLLHGCRDGGEYGYTLFKRVQLNKNEYALEYMNGCISFDDFVRGRFLKEYNKYPLIYSHIDKKYFVNKLVEWRLIEYCDRYISKEGNEQMNKNIEDISIDTGIQLFPEFDLYDYKSNLEKLKQRYENKINKAKEDRDMADEYDVGLIDGFIEGLETAIRDIEDILDGLVV